MRSLALQVTTRSTVQLPIVRPSPGLEDALAGRRSLREFSSRKLNDSQIARLLWAAQGITNREGLRTAPSAGALYPLVVYISSAEGTFRYDPQHSVLKRTTSTDLRQMLSTAALSQESVKDAPAVFVYTAVVQRTARKYGDRGRRYIYLEAGHSAQNLLLEATVLGLGGVPVGAFDDAKVAATLGLPSGEEPIYLVPVGYAR